MWSPWGILLKVRIFDYQPPREVAINIDFRGTWLETEASSTSIIARIGHLLTVDNSPISFAIKGLAVETRFTSN